MKQIIAIPTVAGRACAHFGHCESFTVIEVENGAIVGEQTIAPPAHQPGTYPRYLAEHGVSVVLAGGMGAMAQNLFRENDIAIHMGVGEDEPRVLVEEFLRGDLDTGTNACDKGTADHQHDDACRDSQ